MVYDLVMLLPDKYDDEYFVWYNDDVRLRWCTILMVCGVR